MSRSTPMPEVLTYIKIIQPCRRPSPTSMGRTPRAVRQREHPDLLGPDVPGGVDDHRHHGHTRQPGDGYAGPVLDELDKRIIRLLQRNARVPNTEIGRELDVTETTIRNRVSRLLDEGLIEIVAVVDPRA